MQRFRHCTDIVHVEILLEEFGIITNNYCVELFTFTVYCIITNVLFIFWFFHFCMPIYIWHLYELVEVGYRGYKKADNEILPLFFFF